MKVLTVLEGNDSVTSSVIRLNLAPEAAVSAVSLVSSVGVSDRLVRPGASKMHSLLPAPALPMFAVGTWYYTLHWL